MNAHQAGNNNTKRIKGWKTRNRMKLKPCARNAGMLLKHIWTGYCILMTRAVKIKFRNALSAGAEIAKSENRILQTAFNLSTTC